MGSAVVKGVLIRKKKCHSWLSIAPLPSKVRTESLPRTRGGGRFLPQREPVDDRWPKGLRGGIKWGDEHFGGGPRMRRGVAPVGGEQISL